VFSLLQDKKLMIFHSFSESTYAFKCVGEKFFLYRNRKHFHNIVITTMKHRTSLHTNTYQE